MNVFISYAHANCQAAKDLAYVLKEKGLHVSNSEDDVMPGENWMLKVGQALKSSKAMVVLLSPDSSGSKWVQKEIEFAINSPQFQGRLIPVMLKKTESFPWILKKLQVSPFDPEAIAARLLEHQPEKSHGRRPRHLSGHRLSKVA